MPDESTKIEAIKTVSDGNVTISVEKYNELIDTIASQTSSISGLKDQLTKLRREPPVINETIINKTPEMLAQEYRTWGIGFMGLGTAFVVGGAFLYKAGLGKS